MSKGSKDGSARATPPLLTQESELRFLRSADAPAALTTSGDDVVRWSRFGAEVDKLRETVATRLGPEALSRYPSLTILMD